MSVTPEMAMTKEEIFPLRPKVEVAALWTQMHWIVHPLLLERETERILLARVGEAGVGIVAGRSTMQNPINTMS